MFITSEALKKRIAALSNEIYKISNGAVSFEEYIALPHYGRICLRFNLNLQIFNLDDLDNYERTIWVTFTERLAQTTSTSTRF